MFAKPSCNVLQPQHFVGRTATHYHTYPSSWLTLIRMFYPLIGLILQSINDAIKMAPSKQYITTRDTQKPITAMP